MHTEIKTNAPKIRASLTKKAKAVRTNLRTRLLKAVIIVEEEWKQGALSGEILNVVTGALRRSPTHKPFPAGENSKDITARLGSSLIYAAVHEHGSPARNLPARRHLARSFEKKEGEIMRQLGLAIEETVNA